MWCEKCNYGSEVCKLTEKCPQCGEKKFLNKSPYGKRKPVGLGSMKKENQVAVVTSENNTK